MSGSDRRDFIFVMNSGTTVKLSLEREFVNKMCLKDFDDKIPWVGYKSETGSDFNLIDLSKVAMIVDAESFVGNNYLV